MTRRGGGGEGADRGRQIDKLWSNFYRWPYFWRKGGAKIFLPRRGEPRGGSGHVRIYSAIKKSASVCTDTSTQLINPRLQKFVNPGRRFSSNFDSDRDKSRGRS